MFQVGRSSPWKKNCEYVHNIFYTFSPINNLKDFFSLSLLFPGTRFTTTSSAPTTEEEKSWNEKKSQKVVFISVSLSFRHPTILPFFGAFPVRSLALSKEHQQHQHHHYHHQFLRHPISVFFVSLSRKKENSIFSFFLTFSFFPFIFMHYYLYIHLFPLFFYEERQGKIRETDR